MKPTLHSFVLLAGLLCWLAAPLAQAVTCQGGIAASNPDGAYTANPDGTVTDTRSGLIWDQCTWGQTGNDCSGGGASTHTWAEALGVAATANGSSWKGHADWRLPNIKELESLTEECRTTPAINDSVFPNTPSWDFWSGSPSAGASYFAWVVDFYNGGAYAVNRNGNDVLDYDVHVRLVRGGQSFASFNDDIDGDGVTNATENAGPNGGDGNGDGTQDSQQSNVASLPKASGGGYLTLTTDCPAGLTNVQTYTEASQGGGDAQFDLPYGTVGFRAACESANFTVYYHGVSSLAGMTYRKYGPNPPGAATSIWYSLGMTPGAPLIGGVPTATASFALTDNGVGDDTGDDGVIVDQGGAGNGNGAGGAQSIPALGPLGLAWLSGLLGLAGWLGIRRRRGA